MPKAAVILFADTETPGDMGRMANALTTVKEFKDAGDDAVLLFDGAATRWIPKLADESNKYHGVLDEIRDRVQGACVYCARAYGVKDAIEQAGIPLIDEYKGHPTVSMRLGRPSAERFIAPLGPCRRRPRSTSAR